MVRVFLRELRKARVVSEIVYGASDIHMRVGQYLWYTIQAHIVMKDFQKVEFCLHISMAPIIVNHLFGHRAENLMWTLSRWKFGNKITSLPNRQNTSDRWSLHWIIFRMSLKGQKMSLGYRRSKQKSKGVKCQHRNNDYHIRRDHM